MSVPNASVEAIGIHHQIRFSNAANTVANATPTAVKSGTFTASVAMIAKTATTDGGDANYEPGLRTARIECVPRYNPTDPGNTFPYNLRDIVYFSFEGDGMFTYAGSFRVESTPHSFSVDGDASIPVSGPVLPGWTKTANAAG